MADAAIASAVNVLKGQNSASLLSSARTLAEGVRDRADVDESKKVLAGKVLGLVDEISGVEAAVPVSVPVPGPVPVPVPVPVPSVSPSSTTTGNVSLKKPVKIVTKERICTPKSLIDLLKPALVDVSGKVQTLFNINPPSPIYILLKNIYPLLWNRAVVERTNAAVKPMANTVTDYLIKGTDIITLKNIATKKIVNEQIRERVLSAVNQQSDEILTAVNRDFLSLSESQAKDVARIINIYFNDICLWTKDEYDNWRSAANFKKHYNQLKTSNLKAKAITRRNKKLNDNAKSKVNVNAQSSQRGSARRTTKKRRQH